MARPRLLPLALLALPVLYLGGPSFVPGLRRPEHREGTARQAEGLFGFCSTSGRGNGQIQRFPLFCPPKKVGAQKQSRHFPKKIKLLFPDFGDLDGIFPLNMWS